jgi:hypothetical protein
MKKLFVSFSGGRTSGHMMYHLLDRYQDEYDIEVLFSNTGQEREETLEFVDKCDRLWDVGVVWLEASVIPERGISTTFKVVDFATASRNGEPFESMIEKYGIPNIDWPHCTRELKLRPMEAYMKALGWTDHYTAVGIRADEPRRRSKSALERRIVYPLMDWFPTDKIDVNMWWEQRTFNLELEEHQGNCSWCWKKALSKHARLYRESPGIFEFPARMEILHTNTGTRAKEDPRVFFRQHRSTVKLIETIELMGDVPMRPIKPDEDAGCSESCDVYTAENE